MDMRMLEPIRVDAHKVAAVLRFDSRLPGVLPLPTAPTPPRPASAPEPAPAPPLPPPQQPPAPPAAPAAPKAPPAAPPPEPAASFELPALDAGDDAGEIEFTNATPGGSHKRKKPAEASDADHGRCIVPTCRHPAHDGRKFCKHRQHWQPLRLFDATHVQCTTCLAKSAARRSEVRRPKHHAGLKPPAAPPAPESSDSSAEASGSSEASSSSGAE
jgi:hypothetical protein